MKVKLGCDGCIRRKTMFCPPSIECMSLDDLPYYLDKTSALEEIERLNNIVNEFESWSNNIPNYFMDKRSNNTGVYVQKGMQQMIDMCKNKLQELKGSDK